RQVISRYQPGASQVTVLAGTPMMPYPIGSFMMPLGLAFHHGALYVTDPPMAVVLRVDVATGQVSLVSGTRMMQGFADGASPRFNFLAGIASDGGSYLYVADAGNQLLRRVDAMTGEAKSLFGQLMTMGDADGKPADARLNGPNGVAWADGTVYVSEGGNHTLRAFDGQMVSTVAGRALHEGYAEDQGAKARFRGPTGLAADGA